MRQGERSKHVLWLARSALAAAALAPTIGHAQVLEVTPTGSVRWLGEARATTSARAAHACPPAGLAPAFEAAARRYELSFDLLVNVAQAESNCDAEAVSPAGAIGLMQLMPATARELGVDPHDAVQNVHGGAAYLRQQIDRFDGRIDLALAAYNAGPGAVERSRAVPPYAETRRYVDRNLDLLADRSLSQGRDEQ
jgi:soluble lytic murein transglycosylase-like protein